MPKNLRRETKNTLIVLIREMEGAIKKECCRCMNVSKTSRIKDCGGLHLEEGNCPLYEFRPWGQDNIIKKGCSE